MHCSGYRCYSHQHLEARLHDFINTYNYWRRLKRHKGLSPLGYICKLRTAQPNRFALNPTHRMQ
ncbi:MAG: integrase core domain-containing protein [Alphaproteobacteria bacterium]|nr:integrase core domain-containing protein [Alphaproteobacteria bacterium]